MIRRQHHSLFSLSISGVRWSFATTVSIMVVLLSFAAVGQADAQTFTVLYSFQSPSDGDEPLSGVIRDGEGNLYGTTYDGGASGYGIVFKIDKHDKETVLYSFAGGSDGANPEGGLVRDAAGNLYGTTDGGGNPECGFGNYCGTVYKVDKNGNETVLYRFGSLPDGHSADSSLILDEDGNLYGTTGAGGDNGCNPGYGCGTVFKIDKEGREIILHTFTGTRELDGAFPLAGLVADANGYLYGTTSLGGAPTCILEQGRGFLRKVQKPSNTGGCGTIFRVDKQGKETILHRFSNYVAGASPDEPLILDNAGNLYGTASGGSDYNGIVFTLDKHDRERVLYNFSDDEGYPAAGLVRDAEGNLYGLTNEGGTSYEGTVFKLDKSGALTILHGFSGTSDGGFPRGTLVMDEHGNVYGTARDGGIHNCGEYGCGVVFKITP